VGLSFVSSNQKIGPGMAVRFIIPAGGGVVTSGLRAISEQARSHSVRWLLVSMLAANFPLNAQGAATDCNAIVSMSQGRQVYNGESDGTAPSFSPLETSTGEQWMLLFRSGKALSWWTNPSNWTGLAKVHSCGADSEIDSVVFIFDPFRSTDVFGDLATVLDIINSRYPSASAHLTLLVGGEGHVTCKILNSRGRLVNVHASVLHASLIEQMTMPEAGPDLDVPCSEYASTSGSLTTVGAAEANAELGSWFVANVG
jgi:hypothetical protein